jgi:hypothetical protein
MHHYLSMLQSFSLLMSGKLGQKADIGLCKPGKKLGL